MQTECMQRALVVETVACMNVFTTLVGDNPPSIMFGRVNGAASFS